MKNLCYTEILIRVSYYCEIRKLIKDLPNKQSTVGGVLIKTLKENAFLLKY